MLGRDFGRQLRCFPGAGNGEIEWERDGKGQRKKKLQNAAEEVILVGQRQPFPGTFGVYGAWMDVMTAVLGVSSGSLRFRQHGRDALREHLDTFAMCIIQYQ